MEVMNASVSRKSLSTRHEKSILIQSAGSVPCLGRSFGRDEKIISWEIVFLIDSNKMIIFQAYGECGVACFITSPNRADPHDDQL